VDVQNHHAVVAHYLNMADMLRDVGHPGARACFDAWSPALHGANGAQLQAAARTMGPLAAYTTIADDVRRPCFTSHPDVVNYSRKTDVVRAGPMGDGFIDYQAFLKGLREGGYSEDSWVAYKLCSPLEGGGSEQHLDRYAQQVVAWMREHRFAARGKAAREARPYCLS
jgi:sugar phosphate isomerase/epimerase